MDHAKFTTIAHRNHRFCNPLDPAVLERATDGLGLRGGDRVVDVGCGKAALLVDLAARHGVAGGVDVNAAFLDEGRALTARSGVAAAVTLIEAEAGALDPRVVLGRLQVV